MSEKKKDTKDFSKNLKKVLEDFNVPKQENIDIKFSARDNNLAEKEEKNWSRLSELNEESKLLENQRYKDDTQHRKILTTWAGTLVSFWLIAVILILVGNTNFYKLNDSVLITLLGTTTLNVLGLMVIVLSDLFNKKSSK